jgi:hypothetical protein
MSVSPNGVPATSAAAVAFTPARICQGSVFEAANSNLAEARLSQRGTCIR